MSTTTRIAGGAVRHLALLLGGLIILAVCLVGPPALILWAFWVSLAPAEPVWWVAAAAAVGALAAGAISARRVASDLRPEITGPAAVGAGASRIAGTLVGAKSAVGVMAWRTGAGRQADLLDKLSALVTVLLAVAAVGLAPGWVWAYALVLGPVASTTVARRAGAWRGVSLRPSDLPRHWLAGLLGLVLGAVALGAVQWWLYDGQLELEPAATMGAAVCGLTAGITATSRRSGEERERRQYAGPLAKSLGVSDSLLSELRWRLVGATIVVQGPLPGAALIGEVKLEESLAEWLPEFTVVEASTSRIVLGPLTDEVTAARAIRTETEGLVVAIMSTPLPDRPVTDTLTLNPEDFS